MKTSDLIYAAAILIIIMAFQWAAFEGNIPSSVMSVNMIVGFVIGARADDVRQFFKRKSNERFKR